MNWSLASQACCSLNEDTTDFLYQLCPLGANQHHDLVIPLLPEMEQNLRTHFIYFLAQNIGQVICILICAHRQELIKSVRSCGSSSLLSMIQVMVWYFLSDSHKVVAALIVMLPSNCCCGDVWADITVCYMWSQHDEYVCCELGMAGIKFQMDISFLSFDNNKWL